MTTKKRPPVDLNALTSGMAVPMPEALQRSAPQVEPSPKVIATPQPVAPATAPSANLEALAFKVPPEFRKRFRRRAVEADLKLNELLFAAFAAWEREQEFKE